MQGSILLWLLVLVLVGCHGMNWEGYWETGSGVYKYYLLSCLDSNNVWSAVVQDYNHVSVIYMNGTLDPSPNNPTVTGTCDPPQVPPVVDFVLTWGGYLPNVFIGSTIRFIVTDQTIPFDLRVTNSSGFLVFESLSVQPGTPIFWRPDSSLVDTTGYYSSFLFMVSWGQMNEYAYLYLTYPGSILRVNYYGLNLYVFCSTISYYSNFGSSFYPITSTKSPLCGDYSKLWVGQWETQINPALNYFGDNWFVCQSSSSGGLISSFGDTYSIASVSNPYFFTESANINIYSVSGDIVLNTNLYDIGQYYFELSPNQTTFSGIIVFDNTTYNVVGTLASSSSPYSYLCSPFDIFGGLWIESQYSSWMSLCVDKSFVYGSYFGGAVTTSGQFTYSGSSWTLSLTSYNTRVGETTSYSLYMDRSTTQQPLLQADNLDYGRLFATPEYRIISNCYSIPSTWGVYSDELFSSELYMCTGEGNTVYGSLNNGTYTYTATLTDVNIISGKLAGSGLSFVWVLDGSKISAEYKDDNGVSISTTMNKISDDVTLSQCNGFVLSASFVGSWLMDSNTILYFCQVSDTEIDGKMDKYYFSGTFQDGMLTGTYTGELSGVWTAHTNKEENTIVLTIDNTSSYGTRYTRTSNTFDCGSWKTFWKSSFGITNTAPLLGGCFSVCFQDRDTDFSIIFFNSEMLGNGTFDPSTGTLKGILANGWDFSMRIISSNFVEATFKDTSGATTVTDYTLCSSFPANYSANNAYPNCLPRRFEPVINLQAASYPSPKPLVYSSLSGGVDITTDGKMAIVATGNTTFVMENSRGSWRVQHEFSLHSQQFSEMFQLFKGPPAAITNTHAFILEGMNISVHQYNNGNWESIGYLESPCDCYPFYIIKSFSDGFCVLESTWQYSERSYYIALYNISYGQVQYSPIETVLVQNEIVLSVAVHSSWLVYSTFNPGNYEIKVYYCSLSLNGISTCSTLKLATITTKSYDILDSLGLGFSVAVNSNYMFVGYPSSQNNNGSVYVYKFNNHIWRLSQILFPPDSGFHQSFGRTLFAREKDLIILKAQDNTLKPYSMALFSFTLSSNNWVPNFKFVSEDWPAFVPSSTFKKRQYIYPPNAPLESPIYWTVSNNGTLFITSPNLDSFIQTWYSCPSGFWGTDCSSVCPCSSNSTCIGGILGYTCSCLPNTYGTNCENKCIDCNGALCDDGATGTGICLCNSSQYGPGCLPCSCQKGVCSSGSNGTGFCACQEGYTGTQCELSLESVNALSTTTIIAISVAIPCAVLIFCGLLLCCICRRKQTTVDLADLPEDLRWFFDAKRIGSELGWTDEKGYLRKDVKEDKRYLKKLNLLMEQLDGKDIEWSKAHAIYNSTLLNNFLGFRSVTLNRHRDSPALFKKEYVKNDKRDWVMEQYNKLINNYEWNDKLDLPIVPVIHGTDVLVAKSICATGFAALSSLDAGFYGKGIYATSSCLYALPYYAVKQKPAILICLATPGNVSPVIEDSSGMANNNNCDSHS
eukprot:TRINITY_DN6381_c0_g1_i3.p1 TRINITY_DN6381_c0_g1~~TRINITY_DN6381_c0_g1_i3.p1  ORF type:complete len:1500 (-),score=292.13 TRINITY_DN6381_c0_g1_i3:2677-7176(-)